MNMKRGKSVLHTMVVTLLLMGIDVQASGVNGINGGMPNRISMNVTVPKQTQGATFGEKVNAGLHAAGSVVANGSSSITIACGSEACAVAFPGEQGVRIDLKTGFVTPVASSDLEVVRSGTLAQGASLLGAALPGGSIISAAVSSVGSLAGSGGGAAAASYAKTGQAPAPGELKTLRSRSDGDDAVDVLDPLTDGDYQLTVVVEKATSGLKDTLKTQVRAAQPRQVRIVIGFSVEAGVLKSKHDTAKNSVGNIR